jgi:hypothetical protein
MANGSWIVIVTLIVILLLFSLLRKRGGPGKYPEYVQSVIWDIRLNQALVTSFHERAKLKLKPRRFENTNWIMNKDRIGFLGESLKTDLKEIFTLVEQYNEELRDDWKNKSESYMSLDLSHFKELLDKSRQALEDWMITNTGQKELPTKYSGLGSLFFGDR